MLSIHIYEPKHKHVIRELSCEVCLFLGICGLSRLLMLQPRLRYIFLLFVLSNFFPSSDRVGIRRGSKRIRFASG